jgi:hypothetical protein
MASPRSPVGAGDEAIWRKLREAGFDEDSVKRRDKATLIAHIARLESEVPHSPSPPPPIDPLALRFDAPGLDFAVLRVAE